MADTNLATLDELIRRLESATGPSRELDAEIWMTLYPNWRSYTRDEQHGADDVAWITPHDGRSYLASHYTEAIDDAITLIPDGLMMSMTIGHGKAAVNIKTGSILDPKTKEWPGYGLPAIAICIAALKARQQL